MPINFERLVLAPGVRVFGRAVTYTAPSGSPVPRTGVFDREHELVTLGRDGMEHSSTAPVLGIRLSDWSPAPVRLGHVDVDAEGFKIIDIQPDGQGGASLVLKAMTAAPSGS